VDESTRGCGAGSDVTMTVYDLEDPYLQVGEPRDEREIEALDDLREFFLNNRETVFFSRQLEVLQEDSYFHWITNSSDSGS
jgi:hypothetical protein